MNRSSPLLTNRAIGGLAVVLAFSAPAKEESLYVPASPTISSATPWKSLALDSSPSLTTVFAGDKTKGDIFLFPQTHFIRYQIPEYLEEYVILHQALIARDLQKQGVKYVVEEGRTEILTPGDLQNLPSRRSIQKIFQGGIHPERLTIEQSGALRTYSGAYIHWALSKEVTLLPALSSKEAIEVKSRISSPLISDEEYRNIAYEKREALAIQSLNSFRTLTGDADVAIVFGATHQFKSALSTANRSVLRCEWPIFQSIHPDTVAAELRKEENKTFDKQYNILARAVWIPCYAFPYIRGDLRDFALQKVALHPGSTGDPEQVKNLLVSDVHLPPSVPARFITKIEQMYEDKNGIFRSLFPRKDVSWKWDSVKDWELAKITETLSVERDEATKLEILRRATSIPSTALPYLNSMDAQRIALPKLVVESGSPLLALTAEDRARELITWASADVLRAIIIEQMQRRSGPFSDLKRD